MFGFWDDLEELPEGSLHSMPYDEGSYSTYIIRRQGDEVLTPDGWFDLDEVEGYYE